MGGLKRLKVKHFVTNHVQNPFPGGRLPWQVYHTVRNAIVRTCREYGPTGPMGEVQIADDVDNPYTHMCEFEDPYSWWEQGDPDPVYYILDDQLNHERYLYAELYGEFDPGWVHAVAHTLREFPGWGLGINHIPEAYVIIFGDKLLVKGRVLEPCQDADAVVEAVRRHLRRGPKKWWQFWR